MKKNKKPIITILYQNNIKTMRQTKEIRKRDNQEKLIKSMNLIESILKNHTIPKSIKNSMNEILSTLRDERKGEIAVRVANAISLLENITQNPHIQSHIRTNIWQLISTLESIRE
jgi:uncharacterized protein